MSNRHFLAIRKKENYIHGMLLKCLFQDTPRTALRDVVLTLAAFIHATEVKLASIATPIFTIYTQPVH